MMEPIIIPLHLGDALNQAMEEIDNDEYTTLCAVLGTLVYHQYIHPGMASYFFLHMGGIPEIKDDFCEDTLINKLYATFQPHEKKYEGLIHEMNK